MVDLAVIRSRHPSFCSHSDRFPFWALNTKLRAQAQAQGRVFMRKHIGADNLTVADISEKLNSDDKPAFLKTVSAAIYVSSCRSCSILV